MKFHDLNFTSGYWVLLLPCIFMVADIVSGYLKAVYNKQFDSSIMRKGLMHKSGEIIVLLLFLVAHLGIGLPNYICNFVSMYIIVMEAYSICENLNNIGVKIPSFIEKSLK